MNSQLFTEALHNLEHYRDDSAAIASEAYSDRLIDGESFDDVSELSFKARLLTDKALWLDHCAEAILGNEIIAGIIQSMILENDYQRIGALICASVNGYAEELGNE